jgi:hypothetical protein
MLLELSLQYLIEHKDSDIIWERKRLARMRAGCPRSQRSLPHGTVVQANVLVFSMSVYCVGVPDDVVEGKETDVSCKEEQDERKRMGNIATTCQVYMADTEFSYPNWNGEHASTLVATS